ncbi:MAG: hypothetical protein JWO23_489 [Solirubrobacterales bacterium]|nr:hypothetical protein [Solirubrobacterales bacterium]
MGGRERDSAELEQDARAGDESARPASGCARVRSGGRRAILALSIVVGGLLLFGTPALASGTTLHHFDHLIKGEGKCALVEPGAVAVNDSTKEVWVIDKAKNQIDRLSPTGECLSSAKAFSPEGIAIDQTTGFAYVAVAIEKESEERVAVDKFSPEGKLLKRIRKFKNPEKEEEEFFNILGVGVDATGSLWVDQEESIQHFSGGEINKNLGFVEIEGGCLARPGFAVSPNAEFFYVARERAARPGAPVECEEPTVLVKLNSEGKTVTEPPEGESGYKAQLDNENTTGVAVDESDQVYFDNVANISTFNSSGQFVQRFGDETGPGRAPLQEGTGVAVDLAHQEVYVADAREAAVKVYLPGAPEEQEKAAVADGRGWEQVTPQNKLGATIYPISKAFGIVQASEDGSAITFVSNAPPVPAPPTNRAPEPTQNLSRRGSSWTTEDIVTPAGPVPGGYASGSGTQYEFFSSDLTSGLVNPQEHEKVFQNEPLLSPEANEGTPYQRTLTVPSGACEPIRSSCYKALVWGGNGQGNDTANPFEQFGGKVHFTSATPDSRHAVLSSEVPLTAEATGRKLHEGLYEAEVGGGLQLVSVLPRSGEETAEEEKLKEEEEQQLSTASGFRLGGPGENNGGVMRNAISTDGSRVIWSTERGEGKLYLRDTVKHETVRLDSVPAAETAEVEQPQTGAQYQTASTDGSKIFFTDTHRLTKNSAPHGSLEEEEEENLIGFGDLYVCEIVVEPGGKDACHLKDLTAEVRSGNEPAAVQGVLGASDDGTSIYYVADGVLGTKAGRGNCEPAQNGDLEHLNRTCNLYVQHLSAGAWQTPQFIASLSSQDQPDWHIEASTGALLAMTSRVSPNGAFLAFMSNRSLTGYNNVDANTEEAKGARDQEVYLYNASTGLVQCPSCGAKGTQPSGVHDIEASGEGIGLLIDRPLIWQEQWVAANIPGWTSRSKEASIYQSRYLSDTGRLFFNSVTPLVPADKNAKADVYEFELNGEGSCASASGCVSLVSSGLSTQESAFLDASKTGNDVFLLTSEKLSPQDLDGGFDIYDAHVCTGASPCIPPAGPAPAQCKDEEGCRGAPTSVPAMPPVPPSSLPGSGNAGTHQVLGEKKTTPKPKKLTRAQKLAKALKACKKIKKKSKRQACVRQAHKKYDPPKKSKSKKVKK